MADPAVEISCKPYIKCYIYNWRVVHQCCTHTWNKNPFFLLQHAVSFLPLRLGAQWHVKHTHRCTLVCRQWLPYSHPWSSVNVSTILLCLHWLNWGFAVCFLFCFFISVCVCLFSGKIVLNAMYLVLGNFWPQESGSSQQEINASQERI